MNTTYFLNLVAGNVYGSKTSPAIPTSYYIGLSTTAPTVGGSNVREPSASLGYARVRLTSLGTPTGGIVTNTDAIYFPESAGNWGTITHFVIYGQQTGGFLLIYGELPNKRTVKTSTLVTIKPGELRLSVANPPA